MQNQAEAVKNVSWFLIVTSGLTTAARLWTKWSTSRTLSWDDALIMTALVRQRALIHAFDLYSNISKVFNIASGICVSVAGQNGLGSDYRLPSQFSMATMLKVITIKRLMAYLRVKARTNQSQFAGNVFGQHLILNRAMFCEAICDYALSQHLHRQQLQTDEPYSRCIHRALGACVDLGYRIRMPYTKNLGPQQWGMFRRGM